MLPAKAQCNQMFPLQNLVPFLDIFLYTEPVCRKQNRAINKSRCLVLYQKHLNFIFPESLPPFWSDPWCWSTSSDSDSPPDCQSEGGGGTHEHPLPQPWPSTHSPIPLWCSCLLLLQPRSQNAVTCHHLSVASTASAQLNVSNTAVVKEFHCQVHLFLCCDHSEY